MSLMGRKNERIFEARVQLIFCQWRVAVSRVHASAQGWVYLSRTALQELREDGGGSGSVVGLVRARRLRAGGFFVREVSERQVGEGQDKGACTQSAFMDLLPRHRSQQPPPSANYDAFAS